MKKKYPKYRVFCSIMEVAVSKGYCRLVSPADTDRSVNTRLIAIFR